MSWSHIRLLTPALLLLMAACGNATPDADPAEEGSIPAGGNGNPTTALPACDPDNGGLTLPQGFCALVAHEGVGQARHIAVTPDGDVYVAIQEQRQAETTGESGAIVGLRDTDGDGRLDESVRFGAGGGTGLAVEDGFLYFAPNTLVLRYRLPEDGGLEPAAGPDTIVAGFPDQRSHAAKSLALNGQGSLYVNVGAPSNACQEQDRTAGSPGQDPCPQLELQAGIWRYDADQTGQTHTAENRYATGIRNAVAIAWSDAANSLFVAQHGRDQLNVIAPEHFTEEESAELPAEELMQLSEGDDFGWPYCFYDHRQGQRVLAPEYGGDGQEVGRCADFEEPVAAFPGHWAPNDLIFYEGGQFPERYRNGALIAWHGSWNRAPLPQQGYKVSFVPAQGGVPGGEPETFADGFAGSETLASPGGAEHRPMGLALAPDGTLYIVDSVQGRIWRVVYTGD